MTPTILAVLITMFAILLWESLVESKKWSDWKDITLRRDSAGRNFLLQMRVHKNGKKQFKNRPLDADGFPYLLFHESAGIEKILTIPRSEL